MLLFDGELPDEQAQALAGRAAGDPEAVDYLERLELVGDVVRELAAERTLRAPDLTDSIMARVAADAAPRKVARWHSLAPALGMALAMAAAVAFLVQSSNSDSEALPRRHLALSRTTPAPAPAKPAPASPPIAAPIAAVPTSAVAPPAAAAGVPASPATAVRQAAAPAPPEAEAPALASNESGTAPGVSIENVDFGAHDGAIFVVSTGAQATPVVWLSDQPDETRARMRSL